MITHRIMFVYKKPYQATSRWALSRPGFFRVTYPAERFPTGDNSRPEAYRVFLYLHVHVHVYEVLCNNRLAAKPCCMTFKCCSFSARVNLYDRITQQSIHVAL